MIHKHNATHLVRIYDLMQNCKDSEALTSTLYMYVKMLQRTELTQRLMTHETKKRTRTIDSTFFCFKILQLVLSTIASCSCLLVSCRSSRSLLCAPSPSGPWAGLHCYWITAGIIIYLHHHVIRLLKYSSLPHHCRLQGENQRLKRFRQWSTFCCKEYILDLKCNCKLACSDLKHSFVT